MRRPVAKSKRASTRTAIPVTTRPRVPAWLPAILLMLVTLALYWPAMSHDFVNYDDNVYVTANVHVQNGLTWENLKWAFCNTVNANWHPLTSLSHIVDCQLFGIKPWGHHLTSVLAHAFNAALVFTLLLRLTGARWRSLSVAALFAVHPLHVESVAWVSERNNVLSTCFFLLTLSAYTRYAQTSKAIQMRSAELGVRYERTPYWSQAPRSYFLALFLFLLGLLSKPMLVTLPFVLLLLDYWPLGRFPSPAPQSAIRNPRLKNPQLLLNLLTEKIPFFALAAAASVTTFLVQKQAGNLSTVENLPLGARCGNALVSYCRYLGKLFWPAKLAVFYPHPGYWPPAEVLLAGGLLLGISVLFFARRRRSPWLLMGWLWFIGTLVPVIQLVQTGAHAMADRYTYIPSLGVLIFVVWGAYGLTQRWQYQVTALSVVGATAIVLCLGLTRQQLGYWQNDETLFRHALAVTENNYIAHNNLGNDLLNQGQTDEATRQLQEALRLKPDFALAHYNLGAAFDKEGQTDKAINQYQEALRLDPNIIQPHYNLGLAFGSRGELDAAIRQFQETIRLKPDYPQAYYNLGTALDEKGQTDEAIHQFQEAIRLKPDYAEAHNNLGTALLKNSQIDKAIIQYQEAMRLKPDYTEAHDNLGSALLNQGHVDEAISQFQEALRLKPDYAEAHNYLATALLNQGHVDEAIRQCQEALRLKPNFFEAHNALGVAFAMKGQTDEAIRQCQEALRLKPDDAGASNNLARALKMKSTGRNF